MTKKKDMTTEEKIVEFIGEELEFELGNEVYIKYGTKVKIGIIINVSVSYNLDNTKYITYCIKCDDGFTTYRSKENIKLLTGKTTKIIEDYEQL